MQRRDDGGLGSSLVGDSIVINHRTVKVSKLLGEGKILEAKQKKL